MKEIETHLNSVIKISQFSLAELGNRIQNSTVRFAFCGIEKLHIVSKSIIVLYSELESDNNRHEMSIGILLRAILMDMISTFHIGKKIEKFKEENPESLKINVEKECLKLIFDGTKQLIDNAYYSKNTSFLESIERLIPEYALEVKDNKLRLKNEYTPLKITEVIRLYKDNIEFKPIDRLYSTYSKFDHLSHWTSLFIRFDADYQRSDLNHSIVLLGKHLKMLLDIAQIEIENLESVHYFEKLELISPQL